MTPEQKKRAALDVLSRRKTTTCLADENSTSRKFIRQQGYRAQAALDTVFNVNEAGNNDVIYNLPVTKTWIAQLVLALMFFGHTSYRNIVTLLKDVSLFQYEMSLKGQKGALRVFAWNHRLMLDTMRLTAWLQVLPTYDSTRRRAEPILFKKYSTLPSRT